VLAVKWFDSRRGMAAAVVSAGNGLGILALSPLSRWLIDGLDWRMAYVVLGDLAWLIVIPSALLLRPAPSAAPRPVSPLRSDAVSLRRVPGAGPVWAIRLTHLACCAAHSGPLFRLVSHALGLGAASM